LFRGIPLVDAWFVQSGRQRLIVRWMPLTSAICLVQLLLKRRVRMSQVQPAAPRSCGCLATEADCFLAAQTPRIVDSPGLGPRFGLRKIAWWPLNQLADLWFPLAASCARCRFTALMKLSVMVPVPRFRQNPNVFPDSLVRSRIRRLTVVRIRLEATMTLNFATLVTNWSRFLVFQPLQSNSIVSPG